MWTGIVITIIICLALTAHAQFIKNNTNLLNDPITHWYLYKCIGCKYILEFNVPSEISLKRALEKHVKLLTQLVNEHEDRVFTIRLLNELQPYDNRIRTFLNTRT